MMDGQGKLLTSNKSIEERDLEVYTERLKGNKIQEHLNHMKRKLICSVKPDSSLLKKRTQIHGP